MINSSAIKSIIFHSCRKLLCSWVRTTVQNSGPESLHLDLDKPVCYVFLNQSLSDLLVLENECIKTGLPRPYQPVVMANTHEHYSFCYLKQHKRRIIQKQRCNLATTLDYLLDYIEQSPSHDIQIVPVSIFWGRTPDKEQSIFKLLFDWNFSLGGSFRKVLATLVHGRNTLIHFNPAISLRSLAAEDQERTRTLRKIGRILRVRFHQQKTSVIGPDLSHRRVLVNSLIQSTKIKKAIETEAASLSIPLEKAEEKAKHYAKEIASDFSFSVIRFLDIILTWFWNKLYSGVKISNISPLKELAKTNTIIYAPCHRSHIDYLLLSYVLYYEELSPPHIAAGINLNMPFIGSILRKSGAFFMRRTFKGNPLYSSVFYEYMFTLASKGFPIEYFIEGGRSRTGRTLTPKTGMLSISLRSYLRDHRKPVSFVPVYIGYEKLLEIGSYHNELKGNAKKKESPLDVLKTLIALKNHFGKAWINFGDPINLGDYLDSKLPQWRQTSTEIDLKPIWLKEVTNDLARKIVSRINSAAVINPVNFVAMALLSTPRYAMGEQELLLQLNTYSKLFTKVPYSNKTVITELDGKGMILYAQELKLISKQTDSLGDIFRLDSSVAVQMTYYRNNVLHMFAIPSLISCLFVNNRAMRRRDVMRICSLLYPYLKAELFIENGPKKFLKVVTQWLKVMVDEGMITVDQDNIYYQPERTSTPFIMLTVLSKAITQTLERFYITISLLISNGSESIEQATLETQARDLAQRLSIIHGLNAPEFFDRALFSNFIQQLRNNKVIDVAQTNKLMFGNKVMQVASEAFKVLSVEIRHSVLQATHSQSSGSRTLGKRFSVCTS